MTTSEDSCREDADRLAHKAAAADTEEPVGSQQEEMQTVAWPPSGLGEVAEDHIRVPARFMSSAHVRKR